MFVYHRNQLSLLLRWALSEVFGQASCQRFVFNRILLALLSTCPIFWDACSSVGILMSVWVGGLQNPCFWCVVLVHFIRQTFVTQWNKLSYCELIRLFWDGQTTRQYYWRVRIRNLPRCQMFVITNGREELSDRERSNGRKKQREGQWLVLSGRGNRGNKFNLWHRSFTFNSNKSPTWCNNFPFYYPDVSLQLNMFWVFSRPSGAHWLQWKPLVLPLYRGDSRAVFVVGPAGRPDHEHSTTITTIRR